MKLTTVSLYCMLTITVMINMPMPGYALNIHTFAYKAVVNQPVIDLVGDSVYSTHLIEKTLPICWSKKASVCPRIHQLLFNEMVTVLQEEGNTILIELPHLFFSTAQGKQYRYWTLKKQVTPLATLPKGQDALVPGTHTSDQTIAILLWPWHDPASNSTFSAGTKFVVASASAEEKRLNLYVLDSNRKQPRLLSVPQKICIIEKRRTRQESINLFLTIIRAWATTTNGFIPYVWGGSSFTALYEDDSFYQTHEGAYRRTEVKGHPHSGFDCSGLITRAASIAGLPFHFKNSQTIIKHLKPLQKGQQLEAGDIISYQGHVMIVSCVEKNKIIEAGGYSFGHGKVHETSVRNIFKDITTVEELVALYHEQKPITRMHKTKKAEGEKTFSRISIVTLKSLWQLTS